MTDYGELIKEIDCSSGVLPDNFYALEQPLVLRGLVSHWPLVKRSIESNQSVVNYLVEHYNGAPVSAFLAKPEANGRIFYNENVDGFNFVQSEVYLDDALNKLVEFNDQPEPPMFYIGSLEIKKHLPGLLDANHIEIINDAVRKSIWLGNRSMVAPHFDFPDNLACCVIGERHFTLFPPEQLENLYVGPLDFTPAGQAISMVDLKQTDFEKYPKFAEALHASKTALLHPGDAIFIPSMWWHAVESLSTLNGLVNYWWRNTPAYLGVPNNALLHAILSIRQLPKQQRKAWQNIFNHYVFESPYEMYDHLPQKTKALQSRLDETTARKLRAKLLNNLK